MDPLQEQDLDPAPMVDNVIEDIKYTDEEEKCIAELKELYMQTIQLDVELQRNKYILEKKFEKKHNVIFNKRKAILEEFKQNHTGDLTKFWSNVLKEAFSEFIGKNDEKILAHLVDIRSTLYNEPHIKFVIKFHFEPNEYFTDTVLTKTYYLNIFPDPEDPLSYDGVEINYCEGCAINWKDQTQRDKITDEDGTSFFYFFSPPELPEDTEVPSYPLLSAILVGDYEVGFVLKESIIPKAIMYFTGEIDNSESSGSEENVLEGHEEDELEGHEEDELEGHEEDELEGHEERSMNEY